MQDINEKLHEVDFAKHFTIESFDTKIKQMNGYQAHVASPELAMRALVADAFADSVPVAQWMVIQIRTFLAQAAAEAAQEVVEHDPDKRSDLSEMVIRVCNASQDTLGVQDACSFKAKGVQE
jgi:hypothetical protein